MEVLILKNTKAQDGNGNEYEIEGLEIVRQSNGTKVFYGKETSMYKAACVDGTTSKSCMLPNGKLMLQ